MEQKGSAAAAAHRRTCALSKKEGGERRRLPTEQENDGNETTSEKRISFVRKSRQNIKYKVSDASLCLVWFCLGRGEGESSVHRRRSSS